MKAREAFRTEITRMLRVAVKDVKEAGVFKVVSFSDMGTLSFPESIGSNYARARRLLLSHAEREGRIVSIQEVEARLDKFLVVLAARKPEEMSNIDQEVKRLFREIRGISSERYLFLVPIDHLECRCRLKLGDSVITDLNEDAFREIERREKVRFRFPDESAAEHVRKLVDWNRTSSFVMVKVEASDDAKAKQLALQRADFALNVLRLFLPDSPGVIHGDGRQDVKVTVSSANLDRGSGSRSSEQPNLVVAPLRISKELVRRMNEKGLRKIHKILQKGSEITDLEQRILGGILWNGNAVKDTSPTDKLVKYVTALEVLLLTGYGNKKEPLAQRLVHILYRSAGSKEEKPALELMSHLYMLRNRILHAGLAYVEKDMLDQAALWTSAVIAALLNDRRYKNLESLLGKGLPGKRTRDVTSAPVKL